MRLPRPKVCKSDPPPKGNITCSLDPATQTIETFQTAPIVLKACNTNLDAGTPVSTELVATCGDWVIAIEPENCVDGESEYTAPPETGTCNLTATFTFADLSTCVANGSVDVIEPP